MRLAVLTSVYLTLATLTLSAEGREFSHSRDLPPLKLAAADLDTILHKAHALIVAANGPLAEQESARESVKLGVRGHEIEIPHFSLASSVAFPKELFRFCYTYSRPDKPISSVTIDLGDYSRRVLVTGQAADQVQAMSNLLEKDLLSYSTTIGGAMFRRVAGVCLLMAFLTSLMFSGAYWWNTRRNNGIRDAGLFGSWSIAGVSRAMGQVPSRLCSLPELFAFPSRQICGSDFFPQPNCDSCRNSSMVFSSPMAKAPSLPMRRCKGGKPISSNYYAFRYRIIPHDFRQARAGPAMVLMPGYNGDLFRQPTPRLL
jgi:hypothetical protein